MPLIRTDRYALFLALAMATAFVFFCTRNYVLTLPEVMRTWDRLVIWCLGGGLAYLGVFVLGHLALRRASISGRAAYAGLGAISCVLVFCLLGAFGELIEAFRRGAGISRLITPAALGAIFGFLYAWRAGWESEGDDPAALSEALSMRVKQAGGLAEPPAVVHTAGADYYAGPMQVRTSVPLTLLAAVFGALLTGLLRGVMLIGHEVSGLGDVGIDGMVNHAFLASGAAGFELVFLMLVGVLPMTLIVLAGHYVARALNTTSPAAYFGIGLVLPPVLAVLTMFLFLTLAIMILLPTALAMIIYRQMAGLEPVPVKDDVIVRDTRGLIPEDHPRRQFGRVIRPR